MADLELGWREITLGTVSANDDKKPGDKKPVRPEKPTDLPLHPHGGGGGRDG